MQRLVFLFICVAFSWISVQGANGQAPQLINFQAQVDGLSASTASVTFSIYETATGGTPLWSESYASLTVQNGRIQALLGSGTELPASVFESAGDRYLGITVNGETLEPRSPISSVAYALRAAVADRVLGGSSDAGVSSLNALTGALTLEQGDNVTITEDGQSIRIDAAGGGAGVSSLNTLTGAVALQEGDNVSITPDGQNLRIDAAAVGVSSLNTLEGAVALAAGENVTITPDGQTLVIDATTGSGVNGIARIDGGTGISVANATGPTAEISIAANSITDALVQDNALSAASLANNSVGSAEIQSDAVGSDELDNQLTLGPDGQLLIANGSGTNVGDFTSLNNGGFLGLNAPDGDDAVTLEVAFNSGRVTVHNQLENNGVRLWGELTNTDSGTGDPLRGGSIATYKRNGSDSGVWIRTNGVDNDNAWGVIGLRNGANAETIQLNGKNGDISIAGNMSKGSGSFKIDHPLDPTNKYLSHSFVESPDMMNVYNGNVELDENGEAWVELPEWFEALNRDFRYQLTCIGGFAQVYISERIQDNRFKIAGGVAGLEVSWLVTGVRKDPYAEHHRIQVEEDKQAHERGSYLHPEAYGALGAQE